MGFSLGFGSSSKKTTNTDTTNANVKKKSTQDQTQQQSSSGTTESLTSTLDAGTQDVLQQLIADLGGDAADDSDQMMDRALSSDAEFDESRTAIVDEARRSGEQEIGRLNTELGTAAGSSLNSYVAGATAEAQVGLESQLAALQSDLERQDFAAGSEAQLSASQASANQNQSIAALVNSLKGGTTSATSKEEQDLVSELESLLQSSESGTSTTTNKTKTKDKGGGFSLGF